MKGRAAGLPGGTACGLATAPAGSRGAALGVSLGHGATRAAGLITHSPQNVCATRWEVALGPQLGAGLGGQGAIGSVLVVAGMGDWQRAPAKIQRPDGREQPEPVISATARWSGEEIIASSQ